MSGEGAREQCFDETQMEHLLSAISEIVKSPAVEGYNVGYTARSGWDRLKEYLRVDYRHLVILLDKLPQREASAIECELQRRACADRRSLLYRKYHPDKRNGPAYPSVGGAKHDPSTAIHSVYIAWW